MKAAFWSSEVAVIGPRLKSGSTLAQNERMITFLPSRFFLEPPIRLVMKGAMEAKKSWKTDSGIWFTTVTPLIKAMVSTSFGMTTAAFLPMSMHIGLPDAVPLNPFGLFVFLVSQLLFFGLRRFAVVLVNRGFQ